MNPEYTFPADTGYYKVRLVTTNSVGCIDTIYKFIYIEPEFALYIPNAFTPNGDNINDTFFPDGIGINPNENFNFYILDRWGVILFESHSLKTPWDGIAHKLGGTELVQQDIYVWKLEVQDVTYSEKKHRYIGHVTVIR